MENLFLISGQHHWFLSPVCWGLGPTVMRPAQHPGSPSGTVGGGPWIPTVGLRVGVLASTGCLKAQMGWLHLVVWGPPNLSLGESGLWLIYAEPAICILSYFGPRDSWAWAQPGEPSSFLTLAQDTCGVLA